MTPRDHGLGGQIISTVVMATLASMLLAVVGTFIFYAIAVRFAPQSLSNNTDLLPTSLEVIVIAVLCLFALGVAAAVAVGLARRIISPLVAVAAGAGRIADGDLSARAAPSASAIGEAALLIENFNLMADRLEAASAGVAHWNSLIAHELRTPVTILRGRLQGLADGVFEVDEALFRGLLGHVDGLARLIEDLRTVSLVEAGHLDWRPVDIALSEIICDIVMVSAARARSAGFRLQTRADNGRCLADPARIRQAVLALIENALRHASPGMLAVTLDLSVTEVLVAVEDEGPGLPADFVAEAFTPFRRRSRSGSQGSGLGLAVVQGIAQAHGGAARYVALQTGGSRFEIRFPRR